MGVGSKVLIDITRHDNGMKRKIHNIHCTINKIRDQRWFTGKIEEPDALEVANMEKL